MKTAAMMTMAAMLGSMAWAAARSGDQKVVACFEQSGGNLGEAPQARKIASELFQPAGVKLEVLTGRRSCEGQRDDVIVVNLSMHTPKGLHPGALAYARPFEGIDAPSQRMRRSGPDSQPVRERQMDISGPRKRETRTRGSVRRDDPSGMTQLCPARDSRPSCWSRRAWLHRFCVRGRE